MVVWKSLSIRQTPYWSVGHNVSVQLSDGQFLYLLCGRLAESSSAVQGSTM